MNGTARTRRSPARRRLLAAVMAGGLVAALPGARAAGLLVADGGFGGVLEIEEHTVDVTVNNGIAVTSVTQVFVNTEARQVEALYTFPVPRGASVADFSMWINGKEMTGEVLEKKRARDIYESYKRKRRDPGLLEQTDYKTFEMRIFPIGPKARQKVRISYYQELDVDHDWATYVYPLATVTRSDIRDATTGRFAFGLNTKSAIPIAAMQSPSHGAAFAIVQHAAGYFEASLEERGGSLARDIVVAYRTARPRTGVDVIAARQDGEDGYFCLTLTPGEELAKLQQGMDYVFILDISGSMQYAGKMRLSRTAVSAFVGALGDGDRFELITFNVQPKTLFNRLTAATPEARKQAAAFLESQEAKGGTLLHPAVTAAYRYANPDRPLNVLILSDGMTEQNERKQLLKLISARPVSARVFCIGVGNEVNRPLLEQVAGDAGGLAAFISHGDDFERQAQAFRRKLLRPVATGLEVTFGGGGVYDVEPQVLPNLFHGMPVRLYGRYRKPGDVEVSLRADIGSRELRKTVTLELPEQEAANPEIERMWAWHRVDRLLKQAERAGNRDGVVDEIVRLGEGYSIATEYTSFIVLENDTEYRRWKIDRRNALRVGRDREAQRRLRDRLDDVRLKAAAGLGPAGASDVAARAPTPTPGTPSPALAQGNAPRRPARGADINFGGGAALDPFSVAAGIAVAGLALASARRKRNRDT